MSMWVQKQKFVVHNNNNNDNNMNVRRMTKGVLQTGGRSIYNRTVFLILNVVFIFF